LSKSDEQQLVDGFRAGRPDACAAVVRGHYEAVYRFLVHLTRDVHQAEDLTQETFAAAWEKSATFQGRSSLATWLHRIAYTKFLDALRTGRRAAQLQERRSSVPVLTTEPFDSVMADDEARRLYQALENMRAPDRAVLALHYLQGLSYREMAAVLDEPAGTIKWRTSEALNRLRAALTNEVSDHAPRTTP
jgi:RNA polymerase sigma-70 factor (ECF subfamily)